MATRRTSVIAVDPSHPDQGVLDYAAQMILGGKLVAFPTETVYGLGAHALQADAVAAVFTAKGRPATNPLIVHVGGIDAAARLTSDWPPTAQRLAERFWPGPLTLVLPKNAVVPDIVTAGGPTVALRMPHHPVALGLLDAAQAPLAAPSANRAGELSPTAAAHVLRSLDGRIDLILDAGPTTVGIESTVVDLTESPPRILRPGGITHAQIAAVIGNVNFDVNEAPASLRSPGMMPRHYAPRTPAECVPAAAVSDRLHSLTAAGNRVGWLDCGDNAGPAAAKRMVLPPEPTAYAAGLYAALHELDAAGFDYIVITLPPAAPEWLAVHDRLRRATVARDV